MGTTVKYPLKQRPRDSGDSPPFAPFDDGRSSYSSPRKGVLEDFAAASTSARRHDVGLKGPAPVRLPLVDDYDFEEACRAKDLARKFRPSREPEPERDRWSFPFQRTEPKTAFEDESADVSFGTPGIAWSRAKGVSPRRRGLLWGLCASVAILLGAPAVFGIVQSSSDPLPAPTGEASYEVAAGPGAAFPELGNPSLTIEGGGGTNADEPAPAEAAAAPPANAAPPVQPEPEYAAGGVDIVERSDPPATVAQALDLRATAPGPRKLEIATPPSQAVSATVPETVPEHRPVATDPPEPIGTAAIATEAPPAELPDAPLVEVPAAPAVPAASDTLPDTTASVPPVADAETVVSPLSPAQIDRLLARAEELLRNGQITSARLLFQRIADAGDRRGAKGMGMTYDPRVYERLSVTGLAPDAEQAAIWYERAGEDSTFTIDLSPPEAPPAPRAQADAAEAPAPDAMAPGSPEWNAACARRYRSFEPDTGLYTANSGAKRQCQLQ